MNEEAAETLMDSLPPKGWDDLATKSDLAALETKIDTMGTVLTATFTAKLATEIGEVHKQIGAGRTAQTWHMITIVVTILLAMVGNTALPHWFPPPGTQAGVHAPSP